ncbi:MAG: ABC transporter ATP-binding protein [Microbacterium sp.]
MSAAAGGRGAPSRLTLARWLAARTRALLPLLALAALARIAGQLLAPGIVVIAATSVVRAAGGERVDVGVLVLAIVAMSIVKAGLRYLEHHAGHRVAFAALERLRELLFARLIPQAPAITGSRASAELTERATRDIDRIEVFFAHTIPPVVAAVATPAIALTGFALTVDFALAAIIAAFLAVATALPLVAARSSRAASREVSHVRGRIAAHVADDVQGIREILAFEAAPLREALLEREEARLGVAQARVGRRAALRAIAERALWGACVAAVLLVGGEPEQVAAAVGLLAGLWLAGVSTDGFAAGLDDAFSACERVRGIVEAPPAVADTGRRTPPAGPAVAIELDDIVLAHRGQAEPAVAHVSARFAAGRWHVVAGASGSGKSTLASLLVRAWDPDRGEVRVGGVPARELSLDALRSSVALVDQRPTLFPGTVASNLRVARPDASDAELRAALADVALAGGALADGLDTIVGERGSTLSGGERQRLAIARALVARPGVLILDEALSQLDDATARRVAKRLAGRRDAPTVVEITHRTDRVPGDAPVLVLDRGRVVERGTADALRAAGGAFARLSLRG